MPSEREGVPISSLAAFLVPDEGYGSCLSMVAAGWVDGRWAVAACFDEDDGFGAVDGDGSRAGSFSDGGGGGGGTLAGSVGGVGGGRFSSMEACFPVGDVATGDTGGMGPVLHIVYQVMQGRQERVELRGVATIGEGGVGGRADIGREEAKGVMMG